MRLFKNKEVKLIVVTSFITFLVFGLPILFLFWAFCSMAVGGSLLGGFILMSIIITVSTAFALASSGKDPEYLKEVQEKNNRFYAQSRNFYGRKFSTNNFCFKNPVQIQL